MKQACHKTELSYETLKFYCNQGLVPNVKRVHNNRRVFDDRDIAWIQSLNCLKNCGKGITEMKEYIDLSMKGEASIPERKRILSVKKKMNGWNRCKKSGKTEQLTPDFYWNPSEKVEEFQYLHKNQCRMDLPLLICTNTCENQGHFQQALVNEAFSYTVCSFWLDLQCTQAQK